MPPIRVNSKDDPGQKDKYLKVKIFINRSNSKVKVTGSKKRYPLKGLITRNTHVKYQNSSTHCSKVISKVKVSKKIGQTPRSRLQGKK